MKRIRAKDGNCSKARFEVQDKSSFKKRFPNQGPLKTLRVNKGRVDKPNYQEEKSDGPYVEKPICAKCGKKHEGMCLLGTGTYYGCCKSGHMKRDLPYVEVSMEGRILKHKKVLPTMMVLSKITSMLFNLEVIKIAL